MKKVLLFIFLTSFNLFGEYSIGETVDPSDNISWTDNTGYTSNIFKEVFFGKPVMIFFGQAG